MTNRQTEYELYSKNNGTPAVNINWQLKEAGFEVGDTVEVMPGDGYVVITQANTDVKETDAETCFRDNIPETPIQSEFEAHTVGNRLWEMGEKYEELGHTHVANETKHLARRFHSYAKYGDASEVEINDG